MKTSTEITKISAAIVAAQSQVKSAVKDAQNTFFKKPDGSSAPYATLDSVIEASREALSSNKLAVLQAPVEINGKLYVESRIQHESGEFFEIETPLLFTKQDMQGFGSAITYAKRYALGSLLNISTDGDDDGNEAAKQQGQGGSQKPKAETQKGPIKTGDYVLKTGQYSKGKKLSDVALDQLDKHMKYWQEKAKTEGTGLSGPPKDDVEAITKYLKEQEK